MRCIIDHPQPYFPYIAIAPWPTITHPITYQIDWIDCVQELESWLERSVGPHYQRWAYATSQEQEYWHACVSFAREPDRTMFVLRWAK